MYRILQKEKLAPGIWLMKVMAPFVARRAMPGQFIILRVKEGGERIPLTIANYDRQEGWVTIIFQEVGLTTRLLAKLNEGDSILDFVGPLGRASELDGLKRVLCIGGGVGVAPLYPQIKYLWEKGTSVDVIVGARSKEYLILEKEIRDICNNLYITTDDGSYGRKGFVSDVLKELLDQKNEYDKVIAIGPLIMMKVVSEITRKYGVPTVVSMNPIMVDGTGMCGGCRVTVGGEVRYACVDGPDFDGHLVDFDEAMRRQRMYREEEEHICKLMEKLMEKEGL
ncbi:sulfide/dihydroorotate dehydrogenase-like FAD/NAD-binding protein [Caldicoprobacter algeriensis]|uniref:sulfide/dihydroorotate dehydrogenase-like FAD/NAD-binding protein n=1 Tax=Caldicoprobacter algeriensis TaxID=699281 RepID=UPI00207A969E|nr:sulfide/dihydroorotate dehydrogenase-like FAD/NAD-binding protein [Caldicoprobacter algeriensis]MCM8900004.1 sulfide/dihydroorotate dehydrogenase-like FAD/NAD-binding protein [Caldicoprobacter algeriensis]